MAQNSTVELFLPLDRLKILAVQNTLPDGRAVSWQAEEIATGKTVLVRSVESPIDPAYGTWLRRTDWPQWGKLIEIKEAPDRSWLIREWIDGVSLATLIGDGTTVIPENAARILFSRLCRVLARLHREGDAHGRLKPTNVVTHGTKLYVVDPESNTMARHGSPSELTQEFHVTGDLHYLSPEQLAGNPLTPASDVYAIGCMLYETLAGRPPYGHANPVMLCSLHFSGEHDPLWRFRTDVTDVLEMLVRKCLAKEPSLRFQSAIELEHALLQGIEGQESELTISTKYEESMSLLSRLRKARESDLILDARSPNADHPHSVEETDSALLARLKQEQDAAAIASEAVLSKSAESEPTAKQGPSRTSQLSRNDIKRALEFAQLSADVTPLQPLHILKNPGEKIELEDWELIRPPWNYEEQEPMQPLEGVMPDSLEERFLAEASEPFMADGETHAARTWRTAFFLVLIYAIGVTIILFKYIADSSAP